MQPLIDRLPRLLAVNEAETRRGSCCDWPVQQPDTTKIWLSGPSVVLLPCVSAVPVPVCWGFSERKGRDCKGCGGVSLDGNVRIPGLQLRPVGGSADRSWGVVAGVSRAMQRKGEGVCGDRVAGYGGEVGRRGEALLCKVSIP